MFLERVLSANDGTNVMLNACLEVVKKSKKVVIFGAGLGGGGIYNVLKESGMLDKVIAFSDNNTIKWNETYMDEKLYIIPPSELRTKVGLDCTIIIASSAYDIIKKQLISLGFSETQIFLFNFAFMDLQYTDKEFIWNHIIDFQRAFDRMNDEKSRKIFINILNYKITKDVSYLTDLQAYVDDEKQQYFPRDLFEFCENEIFLDIGAYNGDTLKVFNSVYQGNWSKYFGFEADERVYKRLLDYISDKGLGNKANIYNLAAWDTEATLYFDENPGSSFMCEGEKSKKCKVKAKRIDDVLGQEKISFIKMDIEGSEKNAINGMEKLIMKNIPILAVCVYHCRDDFYAITDLLERICPEKYTYYLRQYRFTPTETVCYAIPKTRDYEIDRK